MDGHGPRQPAAVSDAHGTCRQFDLHGCGNYPPQRDGERPGCGRHDRSRDVLRGREPDRLELYTCLRKVLVHVDERHRWLVHPDGHRDRQSLAVRQSVERVSRHGQPAGRPNERRPGRQWRCRVRLVDVQQRLRRVRGDQWRSNRQFLGQWRGWNDGTASAWPDWLEVDFNGPKTINEVDAFSVQDSYLTPIAPTLQMTFGLYRLYQLQSAGPGPVGV